jgi:hypothetical protein
VHRDTKMDKPQGWPQDGNGSSLFCHNSNTSSDLEQPLVGDEGKTRIVGLNNVRQPSLNRRVHWSASTRSLTGLDRNFGEDGGRPAESIVGGTYVKSIVYGGLDAIVTSFALVASISGGGIGSGMFTLMFDKSLYALC